MTLKTKGRTPGPILSIHKSNAYIYREKFLFLFFTTFFWLIRLINYSEPLTQIQIRV